MRTDILALGEPMVEFNQTGEGGGRMYLQGFGGDTSNAAIAAARQGAKVGYLSAVGADVYGRMLRELWQREGVDHAGVRTDPEAFTAVYFVTHDAKGHHFSFFRKGSAASRMRPQDLPRERIAQAREVLAMAQEIDQRELEQAKLIVAEKSLRKGLAKYGRI